MARCGRPCDHALQVPAVLADLHWKVPQIPFIDRVLASSVALQRQGSQLQTVQKTEIRTGAVLGLVGTPVVFNDRCFVSGCRNLRILRSCSSLTRCGRPCDYAVTCLAVGGATDSVHRLIWWTSQFAQRQVAVGYVAAMQ